MFESVKQREEVAANFARVTVDAIDGIIDSNGQVAILTVGTTFVEYALKPMLAAARLRRRQMVIREHLLHAGLRNQLIYVVNVA